MVRLLVFITMFKEHKERERAITFREKEHSWSANMKGLVDDREGEFSGKLFSTGEHWDRAAVVQEKCLAINRTKCAEMCMIVITPSLENFLVLC